MDQKIWEVAMTLLRSNYPTILRRMAEVLPPLRGGATTYDIVHSTILKIVRDSHVLTINSDAEFVNYFIYRSKTVVYKMIQDEKLRHKTHANYNKTFEENTPR